MDGEALRIKFSARLGVDEVHLSKVGLGQVCVDTSALLHRGPCVSITMHAKPRQHRLRFSSGRVRAHLAAHHSQSPGPRAARRGTAGTRCNRSDQPTSEIDDARIQARDLVEPENQRPRTTRHRRSIRRIAVPAQQLLERRGFSRSGRPDWFETVDLNDQVDDAAVLLDAPSATPAVVTSRSTGGQIALDFAHRFPEKVKTLVLLEPPLFTVGPEATAWADRLRRQVLEAAADNPSSALEATIRDALGDQTWESFPMVGPRVRYGRESSG